MTVTLYTVLPLVGGSATIARSLALFYLAEGCEVRLLVRRQPGYDYNKELAADLRSAGAEILYVGGKKGSLRDRLAPVEAVVRARGVSQKGVLISIGMGKASVVLARWGGFSRSYFYYINHDPKVSAVRCLGVGVAVFDAVLAISPASLGPLKALQPPPRATRWIPQFSEMRASSLPRVSTKSAKTFGFIGALLESKGVRRLIQIWKDEKSLGGLRFLGDGPLRSEVEAAASNDARIEYLGKFSAQNRAGALPEVFAKLDVLLVPSVGHGEGIPTVILEALSFGVPILASNGGGTRSFGDAPLAEDFRDVVRLVPEDDWSAALASWNNGESASSATEGDIRSLYRKWFSDAALAPQWRELV